LYDKEKKKIFCKTILLAVRRQSVKRYEIENKERAQKWKGLQEGRNGIVMKEGDHNN